MTRKSLLGCAASSPPGCASCPCRGKGSGRSPDVSRSHQQGGERVITVRLPRIAATAATMMSLIGIFLSAYVPAQQYDALENDYNRLNQQLSGEIASQQEQRLTDHVNGGNGA
jgi:hypothetical protein